MASTLAEAVVISGPYKGEFVTVSTVEWTTSPAEEALFDKLIESAGNVVRNIQEATAAADVLLKELKASLEKGNEPA